MSSPFEAFTHVDRVVHEPARLAILTALSACKEADFLFLRSLTGLTKGNLSSHLSRLEDAGLVEITKQFVGKMPRTCVALTEGGREAITRYWTGIERLRREAQREIAAATAKPKPIGNARAVLARGTG